MPKSVAIIGVPPRRRSPSASDTGIPESFLNRDGEAFRLRTFAELVLTSADGVTRLRSRKELVLLAYLAVRNAAVPRVELAALLWGDRPEARARQSLRQALLGLKREIHDGLDVSTDFVQLLPGAVRLDLHELDADLAAGRVEAALARRTGEFLEGAEAADVEPLASWVRSVRIDVRRRIAAAADATALARLAGGDTSGAVACAAAACAHFPLDEPLHRLLLEMLDEAGRTAEALATADCFATRLRNELDVEPSPTFRALEAGLHRRAFAKQQRRSDQRADTEPQAAGPTTPVAADAGQGVPIPPRVKSRPRTRVAFAAVTIAAIFIFLPSLLRRPADATSANSRIAVLPFQIRGDSKFSYLGEGIVDLVSAGLEGAGSIRTVDPRALLIATRSDAAAIADPVRASRIADRFGAGQFVLGSVVEVGGRIQLSASVYDRDGELQRSIATAAGTEHDVPKAVDELIRLILAAPSDAPASRLTSVAALTTESLPALKAFLTGEAHYRRGEYELAVQSFKNAVAADSMFAYAHFRLSLAAGWIPEFVTIGAAALRANDLRERLPGNDRKLLEAFVSDRRGEFARPARLFREILAEEPHNLDAWYAYAELLFHRGPAAGHDVAETIIAFQQVLALDPSDGSARVHLARLAAFTGDRAALQRLYRERLDDPSAEHAREIAALHTFYVGGSAAQSEFLLSLASLPPQEIWDLAWYTSSFTRDPLAGAKIARVLTQPRFETSWRTAGHAALAHFAAARGRLHEMEKHVRAFERADPHWALETRAVLAAQPLFPHNATGARSLAAALQRQPRELLIDHRAPNVFRLPGVIPIAAESRQFLRGMLALRAGDTATVRRTVDVLKSSRLPGYSGFRIRAYGHELAAWQKLSRDSAAAVTAELDAGRTIDKFETVVSFHSTPLYSNSARRFLRGEAAMALGRPAEAVRWYAAVPDALGYEAIHIAPAELRMAQAYEQMGDVGAAARHYKRFITMWRDCDPELRPVLEQARSRLAALQN